MDVLRKELNGFYESQRLGEEPLDYSVLDRSKRRVEVAAALENDCRVITDAAADFCYIYGGRFCYLIGLGNNSLLAVQNRDNLLLSDYKVKESNSVNYQDFEKNPIYFREMNSSDEDEIYSRIHPEDLVDKRMLEYEFFKFVDSLPVGEKLNWKATCRIRLKDREGKYIPIENSTRVLNLSPNGKVWLILCTYNLSPKQEMTEDIQPCLVNNTTGEIKLLYLSKKRTQILTNREKEILNLIKAGRLSKQIADVLDISVHTVNRHRQNILNKLSVSTSAEAVMAASAMKLLS